MNRMNVRTLVLVLLIAAFAGGSVRGAPDLLPAWGEWAVAVAGLALIVGLIWAERRRRE